MSVASLWERRLAKDGLASLDFDDGAGGIKVGNRGSGKLLDEERAFARRVSEDELEHRRAVLHSHFFLFGEREVYALWAQGLTVREVAKRARRGRMSVFRLITRIEREHSNVLQYRMRDLLEDCEPTTIVLLFALLERAVEAPNDVREMISAARGVPEIRALLEPDEVRADG